jgi:hypothetical protein
VRQAGLERARSIAEAAGGFLGLGGVTARERAVLDELAEVLTA